MERIPDGIYDSARRWNYLPKEEIIRESLQGIPDFINSIPRQLWKKAKLAVRKDTLPGTELYPQDFIDAVYDFVPDMIKGVEGLLSACSEKNIACVRIFVSLKCGSYRVYNVPYIFCSGTSISPKIPEDIRWLVRNIASYDFVSSSDQAFSHAERAFALSLLREEVILGHLCENKDVEGFVIQVHNLNQEICQGCKSFFRSESPYFVDLNGTGYFVSKEYVEVYENALTEWKKFIAFSIGRFKIENLYSEYSEGNDTEEKRTSFYSLMQPYSFDDIIAHYSKKAPVVLFSHSSPEYEECVIFNFFQKEGY